MLVGYIVITMAGVIGANGVPHFVKGMTGAKHMTPFGKPSSAVVNVAWGALNFVAALWLGVWAATFGLRFGVAGTLALAGALLAGLVLARAWENDPVARGERTESTPASKVS